MLVNVTSISYTVKNGRLLVYLYGRGADGKRKIYTLHDTVPYFYVPVEEELMVSDRKFVTRIQSNYGKSIFGKPVSRVEVQYPFHVPEVRNGISHLEADVLYEDRVRYDYGITGIIELPDLQFDITGADIKPAEWGKVPFITPYPVYLDIETKPNDTDRNKQDILSIAIYEPHSDTAYIMVNVDPHPERATLSGRTVEIRDKVIESLKEIGMYVPKTISIIFLRDEKELGEYFRSYLRMRQPDVLVAWNGWDFDFNILEEKYSRIFTGFGLFDMMFGYSMFHHAKYGELESKALDYCAKSVVGHGKVGLTGHRPYDTYKTAMPWFAFYNLSDALLMFEMERKVHVVNHYMYLATLTGVDIKDVPRETKIVESTIFQMLRGTKLVLPSKSEHRVAKEKVGGGKVENPATGLMEYVIYIDLKGEYPSIMRTFNLSPEMVVQEKEVPNVPVYTLPPRDLKIKSKPKGLVPQILTTFATERDLMKKEMKKHLPETPEYDAIFERQEAFKFLMNSFTGVMGNAGFRLYNPGIIDTVTGTGRAHIAWIKDIVENKIGLKVLYADTDSNFILSGKTTLDEAVKVGQDMVKQLNASFDDFVKQYGCTEHVFSISLKKVFGKWFQAGAKKRWTGRVIWEDGVNLIEKKADYDETKGYETRRSSSPDYTRWIQKEMFNLLFTKGTDAIVEFLTEQYKILAGGKIKVEDLGIPIGLNQEEYEKSKPIHVRAAEYSRKYLGKEIHTGDKIKYYYVKNIKGCPETNVFALLREESVPLDLVTIDLDEHIRRCFTQPLEPILEGLGLDIKKIMGIKEVKVRTLMEFE